VPGRAYYVVTRAGAASRAAEQLAQWLVASV
jgi:hypothetical protein